MEVRLAFLASPDPARPRDRWQVAFAVATTRRIISADGVMDFAELALLTELFPDELLDAMGFLDDVGRFTARFDDAALEAEAQLADGLTLSEKLSMITLFYRTTVADGTLSPEEEAVLRRASGILGISDDVLDAHLQSLGTATMGRL